MSIPVLLGLLVLVIIVAALSGVWRARGQGPATVQSSVMLFALAVTAAVIVYFILRGRA
jgi:hypothetical protein